MGLNIETRSHEPLPYLPKKISPQYFSWTQSNEPITEAALQYQLHRFVNNFDEYFQRFIPLKVTYESISQTPLPAEFLILVDTPNIINRFAILERRRQRNSTKYNFTSIDLTDHRIYSVSTTKRASNQPYCEFHFSSNGIFSDFDVERIQENIELGVDLRKPVYTQLSDAIHLTESDTLPNLFWLQNAVQANKLMLSTHAMTIAKDTLGAIRRNHARST